MEWVCKSKIVTLYTVSFSLPQVLSAPPSAGMPPGPVPSAPALSALAAAGETPPSSPALLAMSVFNTSRSAKSLKDLYAITREFNMNKCLPRWPAECQVRYHEQCLLLHVCKFSYKFLQ